MNIEQAIDQLDESQLRVEKHAFDVINSSDTSLNFVREGIDNIKDIVENINELNALIEDSAENMDKLSKEDYIKRFAYARYKK